MFASCFPYVKANSSKTIANVTPWDIYIKQKPPPLIIFAVAASVLYLLQVKLDSV